MAYRWVVLSVILLASFVAYTLRTNLSIVGESMRADLGMNEYQLGLVFSAFAAGYAFFQLPGGLLGDRLGPRRTITLIAIAWTVLTVATALVPGGDDWPVTGTVALLVALRFLVGVANAPFFPVTTGGTIERWFPVRQWGLPSGLSSTGLTLGAAASAPILATLMEWYGWRTALLLMAPGGLVAAFAYWHWVSDDPADDPRVRADELAAIRGDRPEVDAFPVQGAWRLILKNRNVMLIAASYCCMNYVFYLFFHWFFYYLVNVRDFSSAEAGLFTAAQWLLGAVGATLGGLSCDRLCQRLGLRRGTRYQSMVVLLGAGVFLAIGATADSVWLTVTALCFSFGCTQLSEAPMWVATMGVAGRHSQIATGVLNTGGNMPGVLGGLMVPLIASVFDWQAAMLSGALFALIGALLWLFIEADRPLNVGQAVVDTSG